MKQHWHHTSARLHTSQRKRTTEDISSFLYVPPNKSGPHCGGFYCAQPTLGTSSLHTLLTWNTAVAILSQCVCVCVCVVPLFHSLGVFSVRLVLLVFFLFFSFSAASSFPFSPLSVQQRGFSSALRPDGYSYKKKIHSLLPWCSAELEEGTSVCVCVRERERESWCVCFRLQANRSGWSLPLSLLLLLLLLLQENEHKNV